MRWIPPLVIAIVASLGSAEASEVPGCGQASAVVCFVDHAQVRLRSCLLAPSPLDAAETNQPQTRPAQDDRQRNACVVDAYREIDPLYREALLDVRYLRGITRAVMDYYEDWEKVISSSGEPLGADSATPADRWRPDIERLNVKAEHLRQGR